MMHRSLREKYAKKRKERQDILSSTNSLETSEDKKIAIAVEGESAVLICFVSENSTYSSFLADTELEKYFVQLLSDKNLILPINSVQIADRISVQLQYEKSMESLKVNQLIEKFAMDNIIEIKNVSINSIIGYEIIQIHVEKLKFLYHDFLSNLKSDDELLEENSRDVEDDQPAEKKVKESNVSEANDIMSLLSLPSTKEKQSKMESKEILELLSKPTAKERHLIEKFKSQGGTQVMEFCPHGTRVECLKNQLFNDESEKSETVENAEEKEPKLRCNRLHFKKIIQSHTDVVLGDCSFLNSCYHIKTCKYVHYQVDTDEQVVKKPDITENPLSIPKRSADVTLMQPQWIQCDLRYLDMSCLGKFAVIMADPPWDIVSFGCVMF